jgi:hypothetical protein
MGDFIYIKPGEGLTVPDPDMKDHLPVNGRQVKDGPYWRRLLKTGDVVKLEKLESEAEIELQNSRNQGNIETPEQ